MTELSGDEMLQIVVATGCVVFFILSAAIFFHDFKPIKKQRPKTQSPEPDYMRLFKIKPKRVTKTYCTDHFLKIIGKGEIARLNDMFCDECRKGK